MSQLPLDTIKELIQTCGLANTKAKAISTLSKILVDKFGGKVPNSLEDLESLPGVGHKTASVVMIQLLVSQHFRWIRTFIGVRTVGD